MLIYLPWLGGLDGWSIILYTKRLWVRFSVILRGSIPGRGAYRKQPIDVLSNIDISLSLSPPPFPFSLKSVNMSSDEDWKKGCSLLLGKNRHEEKYHRDKIRKGIEGLGHHTAGWVKLCQASGFNLESCYGVEGPLTNPSQHLLFQCPTQIWEAGSWGSSFKNPIPPIWTMGRFSYKSLTFLVSLISLFSDHFLC